MTHLPKKLLLIGTVACALGAAQPAAAQVQPAGTGEPLYTNSTQNTQWFEWPATSGADDYRVRFDYYENNALVANPTQNNAPNGASNVWANWSGVRTLQHGGQYGICAQGAYSFPADSLYYPDGPNSCSMGTTLGRRAYTTIDRSKPNASIAVAGGAAATKDAKLPIQVGFSDDVAGPFPANFLCFQFGGTTNICDANAGFIYGYTSACSVPGSAGKSTTFTCTADLGAGAAPAPDGPVWACVIAADAAIPDNPSGANQSGSAEQANKSDAQCDSVLLDRKAPTVSIDATAATKVGDLVAFGAQASDATSGVAGGFEWSFGDGTAGTSGEAVKHTFTQAGTYEVQVKTTDGAGNQGTATKVVTVSAPATGGGTTSPPSGGGRLHASAERRRLGSAGRRRRSRRGAGRRRRGRLRGQRPAQGQARQGQAPDHGHDRHAREGERRARPQRADRRPRLEVDRGGHALLQAQPPRKAKAGRYTLKVTFKPTGGEAITETVKVKLTGKARKASASTAGVARTRVDGGPVALPDGRFHGTRKRSFTPRARSAR